MLNTSYRYKIFLSDSETPLGTIVTVDLFLIPITVKLIECGVDESTQNISYFGSIWITVTDDTCNKKVDLHVVNKTIKSDLRR